MTVPVRAFCCGCPAVLAQYRRMHNACVPITQAITQAHVKHSKRRFHMSVNSDLRKAKEMRTNAKDVKDADAKEKFLQAAARLEKRAGKNASKIGRIKRRSAVSSDIRR